MKINVEQEDAGFIQRFFAQPTTEVDPQSEQGERLRHALNNAYQQQRSETDREWKTSLTFIVLFLFLYILLGASLTLNLSPKPGDRKTIEIALEAVPVLLSFSGFFVSVLFVFFARGCARRKSNWERTLGVLEKYSGGEMYNQTLQRGATTTDYSLSAINIALALFICVTWVVMYNYFTFTTSGVIGSVISLFITTMVYVILDIQLLKSSRAQAE